jgi:queuosine precursor transporter
MTLVFLAAIVVANLTVAHIGPAATVPVAFALIGFTLTVRDRLHDRWQGRGLALRMGGLIAAGGLASWLVNADAGRIAVASMVAFLAAESADAVVYHRLRHLPWLRRANGSNGVSAMVDSLVFPTIAFGALMPLVVLGQYVAKVAGGALWAWFLARRRAVAVAASMLVLALPVSGQVVNVSAAGLRTPYGTEAVAELYAAAAPVAGLRPYAIASFSEWGNPVVVTQVALPVLARYPVLASVESGATWYPWGGYQAKWTASTTVVYLLPARFRLYGVASVQPLDMGEWALIAGVGLNLWRGR